ncbi:hypothetical protein BP5796_09841 [Coleophoma crateriformis]|uniref:Peptidase M20 dimerisation domain-containing protein n=1 Tax=Coleophoma crateriformis TaxID=565419 RepID=A0A3D8QTN1_9HELO|nr:hypothetical protein BP5796_09841 [Coleophoma crateriformis]
MIGTKRGAMVSSVDSFTVTLKGRGGHAAQPHLTIDPVLLASQIVFRLQGIVSREIKPGDFAVITVGSIEAGTVSNIIPDKATMTIRARSRDNRDKLITGFKRFVRAECLASNSPEPLFEPGRPSPELLIDEGMT